MMEVFISLLVLLVAVLFLLGCFYSPLFRD